MILRGRYSRMAGDAQGSQSNQVLFGDDLTNDLSFKHLTIILER